LREALVSSLVLALVLALIGRRRRWRLGRRRTCIATELQISYVLHIERVHPIAYRHADVTGVTPQILAGDHSSVAKGERVG
jgi:hypothetical protein